MFVSVLVTMGLSLSLLRVEFSLYRAQATTLKVPSKEMEELQHKFKDLPGSSLETDHLALTEEEWELLFHFFVPTLTQIPG